MDPLSGVASVCGITSLAIQLGQGIKDLYDFWKEVQNAPEDVAQIIQGLQIIQAVLLKIAENAEAERFKSQNESIVQDALKTLQSHIQRLEKLLEPFQTASSGGKIRQRWCAVKIVRDKDKIKKCKALINEAQMTLGNVQTLDLSEALFMARQEVASVESLSYATVQRTMSIESKVDVLLNDVQDQIKRQNSIEDDRALSNSPPVAALSKKLMQLALQGALTSVASDDQLRATLERHGEKGSQIATPVHEPSGSSTAYTAKAERQSSAGTSRTVVQSEKYEIMTRPLRPPVLKKEIMQSDSGFYDAYIARIYYQHRIVKVKAAEEDKFDDEGNVDSRQEIERRYMVFPRLPKLLSGMFSWSCSYTRSRTSGWLSGINIQPFNLRDEDSLIFEFCSKGNVDGIKSLFSRGEASPFDVDSDGWTPMHYAAQTRNPRLCKFLAIQGGDSSGNAADLSNSNPIQMSIKQNPYKRIPPEYVKTDSLLDTVRILVEYGGADPSLENLDGLNAYDLMSHAGPDVVGWLLRNTKYDFDPVHQENNGKPLLLKLLANETTAVQDIGALIDLGAEVNCRLSHLTEDEVNLGLSQTWTPLHFVANLVETQGDRDTHLERARLLLRKGASLHSVCSRGETATDRLFCRTAPDAFRKWIAMLREEQIDIVQFAEDEMMAHADVKWYIQNECDHYLRDILRFSDEEEDALDEFSLQIPSIALREHQRLESIAEHNAEYEKAREAREARLAAHKRGEPVELEWDDEIIEGESAEDFPTDKEAILQKERNEREEQRAERKTVCDTNTRFWQSWVNHYGKETLSGRWKEWNQCHERHEWIMYGLQAK